MPHNRIGDGAERIPDKNIENQEANEMAALQKYILALFVLGGALEVLGQVSSVCRPNELFLSCGGCQRTCVEPSPACAAVCRVGCYCPGDLVRGKDGECIPLSRCNTTASYTQETSEPRDNGKSCPDHEEYRFCEPCNPTCDNPDPICPAQCARGCFCKDDLVRDRDGKCIPRQQCENKHSYHLKGKPKVSYEKKCPEEEEYRLCEPCNRTCDNPDPICPAQCARGCFCKDGLVRNKGGKCVALEKCENSKPKRSQRRCSPGEEFAECACEGSCSEPAPACTGRCASGCACRAGLVRSPTGLCVRLEHCPRAAESPPLPEQGVEACAEEEEWLACGWCERTCSTPAPLCPAGCVRGCLCRPPLLRHRTGRCVPPDACRPKKCSKENEEYACRYPCEESCSSPCVRRATRCSLGCHCRLGYIRDNSTGHCVTPERCAATELGFIIS